MALIVECPNCRNRSSLKRVGCWKCGINLKNLKSKVYWIEYKNNNKLRRERIGTSKRAAEHRLHEVKTLQIEKRQIKDNKNHGTTLKTVCNWYLSLKSVQGLHSFQTLVGRLHNVLRILGENLAIEEINLELIEEYQATRCKEPSSRHKEEFTKPATVNKEVSALKTMLNKAVSYGQIEFNPIEKTPLLTENNARTKILADEEFERLLEYAADYLRPVLITAFYEPMRKSEILGLTWDEIDFEALPGFIRLKAARTKTKKARIIPLHHRVREILMCLPSRFQGGRVFRLPNGKPFDDCRKAFKTTLKLAGIEDFVFHDFRHCAITNLRRAGNDYTTIMKASGHETMSMFFRYNLVDEEDLKQMKWKVTEKENYLEQN